MAEHTLKSFDRELNGLRSMVRETATLAGIQVTAAIDAMTRGDAVQAAAVIAADERIDRLDAEIERQAISMLGRRAPLADDLREIVSVLKIAGNLERVGDYAKSIARRLQQITGSSTPAPIALIPDLCSLVVSMTEDAVKSFLERDPVLAAEVIARDGAVDRLHDQLARDLLGNMVDHADQTTQSAHLLFVAKNLERVGDHATNIAELASYGATGVRARSRHAPDDDHGPFGTPRAA